MCVCVSTVERHLEYNDFYFTFIIEIQRTRSRVIATILYKLLNTCTVRPNVVHILSK